jgi:hypothetical protein
MFDTGTNLSVLARPLAASLGLSTGRPVRVTTITGEADGILGLVEGLGFFLGNGPRPLDAIAVDVPTPADLPHAVSGIYGHNQLDGADYLLDYSNRRIVLAPAAALSPYVRGKRQPIAWVSGRPAVAVLITALGGGVPFRARLVIDSGINTVTLFGHAARRVAGAGDRLVRIADQFGSRLAAAAGISIEAGEHRMDTTAALIADQGDRQENGLLPASMFSSVYVSAAERAVALGGRLEGLSLRNNSPCG